MRITIAQMNPVVGDIDGNIEKVENTLSQAVRVDPDLVVFPELFLAGYPPQDLLNFEWFIREIQKSLKKILEVSRKYPNTGLMLGAPFPFNDGEGRRLYNSALLIHCGEVKGVQHKALLPSYDVFDETRYFSPASEHNPIMFKGEALGITICEDMWYEAAPEADNREYSIDPVKVLAEKGATVFINISASPFYMGKEQIRSDITLFQSMRGNTSGHLFMSIKWEPMMN